VLPNTALCRVVKSHSLRAARSGINKSKVHAPNDHGWVAASRFGVPRGNASKSGNFLDAPWELFHVDEDFSEAVDLAAKNPEKLKELQTKFEEEATKYDVYPLDPRFSERLDPKVRSSAAPKASWIYHGHNVWLPEPIGPSYFRNLTPSRPT
jgi:hypothetical protein